MTGLLLLAAALIVYGSLYPGHFDFGSTHANPFVILLHSWPAHWDRYVFRDLGVNVVLYAPLGAIAFLAQARRDSRARSVVRTVALGAALSFGIELLQAYDATRVSSLLDVLSNTAGVFSGAVLALLFQPDLSKLLGKPRAKLAGGAAVLLFCWGVYQLYPFLPVLSRTGLRMALEHFFAVSGFSAVEMWIAAAGWFAAALALDSWFAHLPARWLAAFMLAIPFRLLLPNRTPGLAEVTGAALALVLWGSLRPSIRASAGLWMLVPAIVAQELVPFRFSAEPRTFSWVPFAATLASDREAGIIVLSGKAVLYGATIWLLTARRWTYLRAAVTVAVPLAALELAQRYIPARIPEITDSVVAVLMACALGLFERSRRAHQ